MRQQHRTTDDPAGAAAPRWRSALDALVGAPLRLHRHRHLHAEVIEDALRAFDCGPGRGARP
jgi:hypothetical protein